MFCPWMFYPWMFYPFTESLRVKFWKDGDTSDKSTKFCTDAVKGLRFDFLIGPTSVDNIMMAKRGAKGAKNALYKLTI